MTDNFRPCPDNAAISIKGEHFPCDAMRGMSESSDTHEGWPHASSAAEAVWMPATGVPEAVR